MTPAPKKRSRLTTCLLASAGLFLVAVCGLVAIGVNNMPAGTVVESDPPTAVAEPTARPVPTAVPAPTIESIREQQTLTAQIGRRLFLARDYGDEWPFTVDEVEVSCLPGRMVVIDAGGTRYGLNGTSQRDYPRFDPVWVTETDAMGLRKSVGPFLDEGLELCE